MVLYGLDLYKMTFCDVPVKNTIFLRDHSWTLLNFTDDVNNAHKYKKGETDWISFPFFIL